ncbi:MAG: nuclear transport factor 2 family protein [Rikenellaceae bacterium]
METISNKAKVEALLNAIESGAKEPMAYINAEKFKQHNLTATDGVAGFSAMMAQLAAYPEPPKVNVLRIIEDGDYVAAQTKYNLFGEKIGFDIFRFEDGLIVEHWDNLQERPKSLNPSGRKMIDGVREVTQIDNTEQNRALIQRFAEEILVGGDFSKIAAYFDGDNYIQHNPSIGDGLSAFGAAVETMAKSGVVMQFDKIHKVLCEGNFALLVTEGRFGTDGGNPTAFYDFFRIENGKIAEHWDVVERIPEEADRKNSNGKFGFKVAAMA